MISGFRKTYSMNSDQQQKQPEHHQQPEGAGMIEFLAWLEVNKKRLAVALILALAVGFGIYVYNYMAENKETDASAALIAIHPPITGTNEIAIPASAYLKVAEQHSGTAAAERAILLAAGALFAEGKFTEAQVQFDRLLKEHPSSKWAADASYGVAASLESQGKRDEALTAYQRVYTSYATSSVANEARMAAGRMLEAKNQPAEAMKQYEEVARGGSMMSMRAQQAMMARNELLKKHPELDKPATNAIAPMAFPPPSAATNKPATNAAPMTSKAASATNTPAGAQK